MLRRHDHPDRERLERRGLDLAAAGGIPVAPRIPTIDGRDVVVEDDERSWSLYEWAPGRHVPRRSLEPVHAAALGRMLARVHDALADAAFGDDEPPEPVDRSVADTLGRIDELLEVVRAHPTPGDDERAAIAWLEAQAASLRAGEADEPPPPLPASALQLVHGDYHDGNVLFDETGHDVVAVLDWDRCRPWWPALEVVRCLALSFHLEPALVAAFLDGYRLLTLADLDDAAAIYGFERAHDLWFFRDLYLRGNERLRASVNPNAYVAFASSWGELRGT